MSVIPVTATATRSTGTSSSIAAASSSSGGVVDSQMITSNFSTFLQLLTTQLKNQNPLDPLDNNQCPGRAADEIEWSAQSTAAAELYGSSVVVDGSNGVLSNGKAT